MKTNKLIPILSAAVSVICLLILGWFLVLKKDYAYVDSNKILLEYREAQSEQAKLEEKIQLFQNRLDTLEYEYKARILEKADPQEIKSLEQRLQSYNQTIQENIMKERAATLEKLSVNIRNTIQTYGEKHGYDIIFVANDAGVLSYAKTEFDLTEKIIELLNEPN